MGHVARLLEREGIPTVTIAVAAFRPRMEVMLLPRLLLTQHPMGRPVGAPGDVEEQRATILAALDLLAQTENGGTIKVHTGRYRPGH